MITPITLVPNIASFLNHCASNKTKARIDRRETVEVCFSSGGSGQLTSGAARVEKIDRWLTRPNGQRWAQTESGDIWPVRPHNKPHVATYFAMPGE